MPARADLALGAGDLASVEVDVEVVPAEALVLAVLAGGVAWQWPGDRDLVFPRVWMPGRFWASFEVAGVVATSVITFAPPDAQVSVR